ncbi:hypothetical protein D3C86_1531670 [compost metagenome]
MLHYAWRTGACRVEQNFIETVLCPRLQSDILFQIFMKKCHIVQRIALRIFLPFCHQSLDTFNADNACRPFCQWKGEIPHSAEQIEHSIARLNIQPLNGGGNHLLVHAVIYLNEVARAER